MFTLGISFHDNGKEEYNGMFSNGAFDGKGIFIMIDIY